MAVLVELEQGIVHLASSPSVSKVVLPQYVREWLMHAVTPVGSLSVWRTTQPHESVVTSPEMPSSAVIKHRGPSETPPEQLNKCVLSAQRFPEPGPAHPLRFQ